MMLKINYRDWFYNQYKYLKGSRKGKESFNDTKWINMVERYQTLVDMGSSLLNEQPFGVVGNNYGFDQLLELMGRSNYSFDDIHGSLIDTYNMSLKNLMGKMTVNTQTVMFHTRNTDLKNVKSDRSGRYYVIEAPFNQMHFGERDEFIRQRLHNIHTTENDYYVPVSKFVSSEISDILGFTIICTVNGYICNDCYIAIDDKGFKFKVRWGYSSDVDFIVYKFDEGFAEEISIDTSYIRNQFIPNNELKDIINKHSPKNYKCLLNIYDPNFRSSTATVPNFGVFTNKGIQIVNIQNKTLDMIEYNKSEKINVVVYVLKYFHEIPNMYPAINYYEMIDSRNVYTDKHDPVKDIDGNIITATDVSHTNNLEICTPPISLDRSSTVSFNTIIQCLQLSTKMNYLSQQMDLLAKSISASDKNVSLIVNGVITPLNQIVNVLKDCYTVYLKGAMLTSLVPSKLINEFKSFIDNLDNTLIYANELINMENPDFNTIAKYDLSLIYGNSYKAFVNRITKPFSDDKFKTISNMRSIAPNFFTEENSNRFNRPVSEYCFITLRYHFDENCWLFDMPDIKHFHGIGNTFYIDSGITGKEVYKFFVLYTDTANPTEETVDSLTSDQILDFDMFVNEVEKHMGYVRYWYAENKLMKLSEAIYGKYDQDTEIQILSKILKRKLIANDLLWEYPSEIEYEMSAIQGFNIHGGENDEYAPFALNFLFYTLNMLNGNEDKLQAYFYHRLTDKKYDNRYSDIDLSKIIDNDKTYPVNLSTFVHAPTIADVDISNLPDTSYNVFYGSTNVLNSSGTSVEQMMYPYTFNVYDKGDKFPLLTENGYNDEYYLSYDSDISSYGYTKYSYGNDIRLCVLFTKYLTMLYSYISDLQTDYASPILRNFTCDSFKESINKHIEDITTFINTHNTMIPNSITIAESIINNNPYLDIVNNLKSMYPVLTNISYQGNNTTIFDLTNSLLSDLGRIFKLFGFDNYALKPVRALYIHLKKINSRMNLYEFKQWVSNINYSDLASLRYMLAKNENIDISPEIFDRYAKMYREYIIAITTNAAFDSINDWINSLSDALYNSHMLPIIQHCIDISNTYTFDMYAIRDIEMDLTNEYNTRPAFITITVNSANNHFHVPTIPSSGNMKLLFQVISEPKGDKFIITSIRNICEYCFFDSTDINGLSVVIKDINGNDIASSTCNIKFVNVGSTSDKSNDIRMLMNNIDSTFDFQNPHETYDVDSNGFIVSSKRAPLHYEMFVGNRFLPLDSTSEMIIKDVKELPGPIDRVYMSNQILNRKAIDAYSGHSSLRVFFKPSQVIHNTIDENGVLTSIGGKYANKQRLYLYTKDEGFVFPVTITAIDASQAHGFVEAQVDSYNSKWFNITDPIVIEKYFTEDIECGIIDDNISNFIDEYSNSEYKSYAIVSNNNDYSEYDFFQMCGDPIYVVNNAPYVYTRLNYFFNDDVPNRFIDEAHKMYHMDFVGYDSITDEDNTIEFNMISHNFNEFTDPELYPILRGEPDDHEIWREEQRVFQLEYDKAKEQEAIHSALRDTYRVEMSVAETIQDYRNALINFEQETYAVEYYDKLMEKLEYWMKEPEKPSTWYNVHSYDAAIVYLNNGRSKPFSTFMSNVSYESFTDKVGVFIYDWEHKEWLNPSLYTITPTIVNGNKINNKDNYKTDDVLYKITITFDVSVLPSKKMMVYFGYNRSDIYDDIEINDKTCYVRFKPMISANKPIDDFNIYHNIRIRKHVDGIENYTFEEFNPPEDVSIQNCYHVHRPQRNGEYQYIPQIRFCDMELTQDGTTYDYTDFSLYVKNPFPDTHTIRTFKNPNYQVNIIQPIDSFAENQTVKLICISNNTQSSFDGNLSTVIFEGVTSLNSGNQFIRIVKSSLDNIEEGTFVCTVLQDQKYKSCGGVIQVTITHSQTDVMDSEGDWIRVPDSLASYTELPNEFLVVPKTGVTIYGDIPTTISFKNKYIKYSSEQINETNDAYVSNPYEYYYDSKNDTKLPISDVRIDDPNTRLVVDTYLNPDVKIIKSTYIGICRYSSHTIPEDGLIDVTGYIPTPLSRNRYEFYVNGRNVSSFDNVRILSPTSFQLCNLRSLKNFELIELVDDYNDSDVFKQGPIFVGIDGKTFSSYKNMLLSDVDVVNEDIKYIFNADMHSSMNDYTGNLTTVPNNVNIEADILEGLVSSESSNDYTKFYNLPTLNGVTLLHLTSSDIGLSEIKNSDLYDLYDRIWKKERTTNPLFDYTHQIDNRDPVIKLHKQDVLNIFPDISDPENWICINITGDTEKYFSLYVSTKSNGEIDDTTATLKIIPFVKVGMYVLIDSSYAGKWLHTTYPDYEPILL